MTQTTRRRVHDYLSTYCWHENHGDCRLECKTCKRPCRCECHSPQQGLETDPESRSAASVDGNTEVLLPPLEIDPAKLMAARLAGALKHEGDIESTFQFRLNGYWRPIAERILADTELLDAVVGYRRAEKRRLLPRATDITEEPDQ